MKIKDVEMLLLNPYLRKPVLYGLLGLSIGVGYGCLLIILQEESGGLK